MSGFEATETQFKPESINLLKNMVSSAVIRYHLLCWFTYRSTCLWCQNCIKFKIVWNKT